MPINRPDFEEVVRTVQHLVAMRDSLANLIATTTLPTTNLTTALTAIDNAITALKTFLKSNL